MQRYRVDLSNLEPSKSGLEAAIVNWDLPKDFENSPIFPKGYPYTLISD